MNCPAGMMPRTPPAGSVAPMPVSVLIADDQALVRAGFRAILETRPDIKVVGEAVDGLDAVDLARRRRPDVVLMDVKMPGLDGLQATRRILDDAPGAPIAVLILTTFDLDEYVYEALRAGASGFLLKDAPPEQLIGAIHTLAAGEALIAPAITKRLIGRFARTAPPAGHSAAALEELTPREREVLVLIARGHSNREIAAELVISPRTAEHHVQDVYVRIGVATRAGAALYAMEHGLLDREHG